MNGHGAPTHNIAINEACDFVSESYHVTMLHLTGLFRADAAIQAAGEKINAKYFSAADRSSFGMDVHAGVAETSGILAIQPDYGCSDYRKLPSQAGGSLAPGKPPGQLFSESPRNYDVIESRVRA